MDVYQHQCLYLVMCQGGLTWQGWGKDVAGGADGSGVVVMMWQWVGRCVDGERLIGVVLELLDGEIGEMPLLWQISSSSDLPKQAKQTHFACFVV